MKKCLLLLVFPLFFACKKDNVNPVVGTWKLTAVYDGRYGGGCSCWTSVAPEMASTLRFDAWGRYTLTQSPLSSMSGCKGTYEIVQDSVLILTSPCQTVGEERTRVFSRTGDTLILNLRTLDALFRYKYFRQ